MWLIMSEYLHSADVSPEEHAPELNSTGGGRSCCGACHPSPSIAEAGGELQQADCMRDPDATEFPGITVPYIGA